jgi:hypothetical protein
MTPEKKLLFISIAQITMMALLIMLAFAGITIAEKISTMERQACLKNNAELWQNTGINLVCKDTRGTFTINRFGDKITPTIITIP